MRGDAAGPHALAVAVTQASVCAACAEWSWLLAHAFAHGCQLPRCDGRTSLVTASYAYARHVQRVPPASAAAPSGAKLASHRACLAFGVTLGTLLDEDTTEGPSERARLMWPCRDPGNSGAAELRGAGFFDRRWPLGSFLQEPCLTT